MKKKILVFSTILVFFLSFHYRGETQEWGKQNKNNKKYAKQNVRTYYDEEKNYIKEHYYILNGDSTRLEGEYKLYYSSGELKLKGKFVNAREQGIFKEYYRENNKVKKEFAYVDGELEGTIKVYAPNGQIIQQGQYHNGQANGSFKSWTPEGEIVTTVNFDNGDLNGLMTVYFKNGKLKEKVHFLQGKEHGKHEFFYQNGNIKSYSVYVNGVREGEMKTFYENQQLESEYLFQNNGKVGEYQVFYSNGQLKLKGTYILIKTNKRTRASVLDGEVLGWYENGKIEHKGLYNKGKLQGKQYLYFANGKIRKETIPLENGVGRLEKNYDKNENLLSEIHYLKQKKQGLAIYYKNGNVKEKIIYKDDKKNGLYKRYFPTGNLEIERTYNKNKIAKEEIVYFENKKVKSHINFADYGGSKQGAYMIYYKNGQKQVEGYYHANQQHGLWSYFDPRGKKIKTEKYFRGELNSIEGNTNRNQFKTEK